jgi:hypothetical protein
MCREVPIPIDSPIRVQYVYAALNGGSSLPSLLQAYLIESTFSFPLQP